MVYSNCRDFSKFSEKLPKQSFIEGRFVPDSIAKFLDFTPFWSSRANRVRHMGTPHRIWIRHVLTIIIGDKTPVLSRFSFRLTITETFSPTRIPYTARIRQNHANRQFKSTSNRFDIVHGSKQVKDTKSHPKPFGLPRKGEFSSGQFKNCPNCPRNPVDPLQPPEPGALTCRNILVVEFRLCRWR